jgi:hypothetical protein
MKQPCRAPVFLFFAAVACACSSSEPAATSPSSAASAAENASAAETSVTQAPSQSASPATSAATTGTPEQCAEIKSRFEKTLAGGAGKCTSDAECGCYPGSLAEGHLCGGVSDVATTDKLREIFREFRVAHCHATSCKSDKCQASCKQGACVSG